MSGDSASLSPSYRSTFLPIGIGIAFAILAVLLAASLAGWWYVDRTLNLQSRSSFDEVVTQTASLIDQRLQRYFDLLRGFRGLYAASKSVERDEFSAYYRGLRIAEHFPGMRAVNFVERVAADAQEPFLQRMRGDTTLSPEGYPSFRIHPEGERPEYFVVAYIEPHGVFDNVLGYDAGFDAVRRSSLEQARDTGEITVTKKLNLFNDARHNEAATLAFVPVYRNGQPVETLQQRRQSLFGFVQSVFRYRELFDDLLGPHGVPTGVHLDVYDGEMLSAESRFYEAGARRQKQGALVGDSQRIETLQVGGHIWVLRFLGSPGFGLRRYQQFLPLAVLWAGVVFSLLVFWVLYNLATSRSRAVALAGRMTQDLRKSETHFRSLIEHAMDAVIILEPLGPIRYASPSIERITGFRADELTGQNAFSFMHPEDIAAITAVLTEAMKAPGTVRSVTFRSRHKQGSWVTLEAIGTNLITDPVVRGIVINARDITDRAETQRQLKESSERFRALVSNIPGAVYRCACDSNWTMAFISEAIEGLSGYPAADFIDNAMRSYASIIHPEDRLTVERLVLDAVVKREPYLLEYRIQHADGSTRWVYEKGRGVFAPDGAVLYLDGVIFDMTQRKEAEETVKSAYEQLKQTQSHLIQSEKLASIGELAAGVAHEVKNPLAIVMQGVNFLEVGPVAQQPQEQEILQMMKKAVVRADHIIRSLLEFARPSAAQIKRMHIGEILESSVLLAKTQLSSKQTNVTYTSEPSLPEVMIDGNQLRQVFVNLIVNAFQAMPNGGEVLIRSFAKPVTARELGSCRKPPIGWQAGQTGVFCEVEDSGVGIPEELLKRVGDPFFTTKPAGQGTGLGLSVTQTILEAHRGLFVIESRQGHGTKMTVILPVADGSAHG